MNFKCAAAFNCATLKTDTQTLCAHCVELVPVYAPTWHQEIQSTSNWVIGAVTLYLSFQGFSINLVRCIIPPLLEGIKLFQFVIYLNQKDLTQTESPEMLSVKRCGDAFGFLYFSLSSHEVYSKCVKTTTVLGNFRNEMFVPHLLPFFKHPVPDEIYFSLHHSPSQYWFF